MECVYRSSLYKCFDIKAMAWLEKENLNNKLSRKMLQKSNRYLLTFIVKPLIRHFYEPIRSSSGYEIAFIEKSRWHSFQNKAFNHLITHGHLKLCSNHMLSETRGVLRIMPKSFLETSNYRSYVSLRNKHRNKYLYKKLSKAINEMANNYSQTIKCSLFIGWRNFSEKMISKPIYGIKVDIQDAFGNVDVDLLCEIIKNSNVFLESDKLFILHHVKNQYVVFRKRLYKWEHGLLQGDPLSSSLCNLYIGYLESLHLSKYIRPDTLLYRVVDDYLFCSSIPEDITEFKNDLSTLLLLNESKTEIALPNNNISKLTYAGQVFDFSSKEVGRSYDLKKKSSLRYKFKLWNIKKPIPENFKNNFILNSLHFKNNNYYFKPMELNTSFNTEEKVLYNYFEGMVFIAYKFDVVMKSLVDYRKTAHSFSNLDLTVKAVLSGYANICLNKVNSYKGQYFSGNIKFDLLLKIAYKALILVLKRRSEFYEELIRDISCQKLFLNLDGFLIKPSLFTKIPGPLRNVVMNRKSKI